MKRKSLLKFSLFIFISALIISACKKDDSPSGPSFSTSLEEISFQGTVRGEVSAARSVILESSNLSNQVSLTASAHYEVSKDNATFTSSVAYTAEELNGENVEVFVRFAPSLTILGDTPGTLVCSSSDFQDKTINLTAVALEIPIEIRIIGGVTAFDETVVNTTSASKEIQVEGLNLTEDVAVVVTDGYEISKDDVNYSTSLTYDYSAINTASESLFIRFAPSSTDIGNISGTVTLSSNGATDKTINLSGTGAPVIHNYVTFDEQATGFGGGLTREVEGTFTVHADNSNISQIKMFVQIDCPAGGCDDWDRFANVKVKEPSSGNWYEIGRYITPYWVGTQQLARGLEFDVTDFKSLLTGTVELRIAVDNWTTKADLITVEFDYIEGTPDYPYYAVSEIMPYHNYSQVPYGEAHSFDLNKSVSIPSNAESMHLRTVISGWGHATPNDPDGRPCAEWCYRTHDVKIDGTNTFQHYLGPLGCSSNPINNQSPGNWVPDRAGWCTGMAVPDRIDNLNTSMAGTTFTFEYDFEDWTNDMSNGGAYYGLSTYIIVKSNTPITNPTVTD